MFVIKSLHLISVHFWTYLEERGVEGNNRNTGRGTLFGEQLIKLVM